MSDCQTHKRSRLGPSVNKHIENLFVQKGNDNISNNHGTVNTGSID